MILRKLAILLLGVLYGTNELNAASAQQFSLGITQIVEHPSLDAVRRGVLDFLSQNGYKDKEKLSVDYSNAQGNMVTNGVIAQKLLGKRPHLILAIGTPAAQAVVNKNSSIPVVFSPITDPEAAKLVKSWDKPGTIATGTSDRSPVREQIELIKALLPNVKSIAILYNAGEVNSLFTVERFREVCKDLGIKPLETSVQGTAMVYSAASSVKADAIYVPTDNTVVAAIETVIKAGIATKTPVFTAESESVEKGAIASLAVNYYQLGRTTGEMILEILEKKAHPSTMPVRQQLNYELHINEKNAEKMGVRITDEWRKKAILHK